jgi:hypothetical protein
MLRIYFTCNWENSNTLLEKLIKNTPSCKGIWKNIIGVNSINECDYIIVLDSLDNNLISMGERNFVNLIGNIDKIIYFQRENTKILNKTYKDWFQVNLLPKLKHNYSYEDDYFYTFTPAHFLNKTYDELKTMEYPNKIHNLSCIVSNKSLDSTYEDRKNFIKKYSKKYPNSIDIYGKGWDNELGNNYKGELGSYHQSSDNNTSKLNGLLPYYYSICLENYPNEKITSEKITDCILCWCLPIYSGTNVTNKYYPNDSFKLINIKNENIYEYVNNISKIDITKKNIDALREARNLILDKYNIWEQIYNIIDNQNKFKLYYNHNLINKIL